MLVARYTPLQSFMAGRESVDGLLQKSNIQQRWRCFRNWGSCMKETSIQLAPRERQIADLLLQGCDNEEIGKELKMARRTVKAHFNRLFLRFGIRDGVKRVKLATLLYRRQLCSEASVTENVLPASESSVSSSSSPGDSKTRKWQMKSELPSTSSKTI